MMLLQKFILWQVKREIPSNFRQSILAYKNCHTFRTGETAIDKYESDDSLHRNVNTHQRSSSFSRPYGYSKNELRYEPRRQSYFRGGFDFRSTPVSRHEIDRTPLLIEKFFYAEHPDIQNRTEEEVENFRKQMNITVEGINIPRPITKFSELCLPDSLMKALYEENYKEPSPIQSQGWPIALSGRDLIGVSQTGSGKTLAYMLPAIVHALNQEKNDSRECKPRILVLGPTRELIQQIHQVSRKYLRACGLIGATAYGGASKLNQLSCLRGAEVCIATPGRLLDFLSTNEVSLVNCSYLVLDEADRMLDMGFEPQIRDVIDQIRPGRQTMMWSATWPYEIRNLATEFLTDYIHITIGSGDLVANPNIKQNIYVTSEGRKEDELVSLLEKLFHKSESKVLVFAQTKRKVDYLTHMLSRRRVQVMGIHGDVSQSKRDHVLNSFRRNKSCVLIATDVAARGLDITDIQHVINFDFPLNIEDYIHRIGRTARGTACGESHSFFTDENASLVKKLIAVLKQSNQSINPELYSLTEVHQKQTMRFNRFNSRFNYRQRMY